MPSLRLAFVCVVLLYTGNAFSQVNQTSQVYVDPLTNISNEMGKVSKQVTTLSETLKRFVDKFEKVGGITLNEKQQRLIMGMEMLTRSELRVATLQKSQADLTEKLNATTTRLAQVEIELRPRNIANSTTFEGTTETEELRESRQIRLQSERANLRRLQQQINANLEETNEVLREARSLADRLRKIFLPQIEQEIYGQP